MEFPPPAPSMEDHHLLHPSSSRSSLASPTPTANVPDSSSSTNGKCSSSAVICALRDGGDGNKLTVEQCKMYLREHGLRLSGSKNVLIDRIKEHLKLQDACDDESRSDMPELQESFGGLRCTGTDRESMVELINTGNVQEEKTLTIEQCKTYLREHGLRLTGTKNVLIERIREHIQIQGEGGIKKYPKKTFIKDCRGDACVGDVVLFKQRVYDDFDVRGRCSSGPPLGIRTVAGRIIKESYGSAKQQHTFTIEVLWSSGTQPLPPLHPLIIKGRNLYRMMTLRQPWPDEEARLKVLQEKHSRGDLARMERKTRMEKRNVLTDRKQNCGRKAEHPTGKQVKGGVRMKHDVIERNATETSRHAGGDAHAEHNLQRVKAGSGYVEWRPALKPKNDGVETVELTLGASLCEIVRGKGGYNLKETMRNSKAQLRVEMDPEDSSICIVRIMGTSRQKDLALQRINRKVMCKFFSRGRHCKYGENCRFSHVLLQA